MKQLQETGGGPLTSICTMQGFFPYKKFATAEEQNEIIKSIEADLDNVTPYRRKQYERVIEHLKSDISANLQMVLVPSTFGGAEGVEDQSKVFPPPGGPDSEPGISAAMCLQYPVSRGSVHIKSAGKQHTTTLVLFTHILMPFQIPSTNQTSTQLTSNIPPMSPF